MRTPVAIFRRRRKPRPLFAADEAEPVEVARALDPQHDMWSAARPIVERWVKRELGAEAVARRASEELGQGFAAMRRMPQTLTALEAAARKVSTEAPREERKWYELPAFWLGLLAGAVLALVLTAGDTQRSRTQPAPAPARIERQAQPPAPVPTPSAPAEPAASPPADEADTEAATP